nr:hp [Calliteara abietis nucleopolyhedrovirus]
MFRIHQELVSIKRVQWTSFWFTSASVVLIVILACYGASEINSQMNAISKSVAAETYNRDLLQSKIAAAVSRKQDGDFYFSLLVNARSVMIHVDTFARNADLTANYTDCPASAKYHEYLQKLHGMPTGPVISNVFLFAGGHGLGKTYASYQLGRALSRFADTVVVSVPMQTFGNLNNAGRLIELIETTLQHKCYVVWTFDELDSYILHEDREDLRDKTITQFAEYTGFVRNQNRVLVFTMNNAEMFLHNYWADRAEIETDAIHYKHAEDLRKALAYTRLSESLFLQENQLSRLYSFVGNKLFMYKPFDYSGAVQFAVAYLKSRNIVYTNRTQSALFQSFENATKRLFSVRELKIALDDIINDNNGRV